MSRPSVGCSAKWIGRGERPIPSNYDDKGRIKKQRQAETRLESRAMATRKRRRRKAEQERRLAAHRKSLHGRKVHEIVAVGNTIMLEKISYKAWQKRTGEASD